MCAMRSGIDIAPIIRNKHDQLTGALPVVVSLYATLGRRGTLDHYKLFWQQLA
jgi:hypothetical protein